MRAAGFLLALVLLVWLALIVGPGHVGALEALEVVAIHLGLPSPPTPPPPTLDALVWDLRLPRSLLAALLGAALGFAGAVTQGLFRNPMAEPGVLGVSAGAAALAVVGFSLGLDVHSTFAVPTLAAVGAGGVLVVLLGLTRDRSDATTLLLSGIALGAMAGALTTLLLALDTERWDLGIKVVRWLMGSLEGRSWVHLQGALLPLGAGLALGLWLRVDLDALQLGRDTAASLGVDLVRTQRLALLSVALLTGAATALAGVIGFLGLVVPHVARRLGGPEHARLLPASALGGALVLLVVDVLDRSIHDVVLPPGALTSLAGAPFFLWLLRRTDANP
ncbi:FecCD family ABC transporter permease [Paraliomyxa miuraensis]|uniref:FecCD family ABC transporter permease n=1 Tax=Paraliomyxa miuraensis TaxID=376150 RepID=UPI00225398D6|nr:iron ABC transporter permease [Paraliomyxa miuraensis]MCX4245444.1 iron ABC transporter permease [Paraliomyxa miuraensis]